MRLTRAGVSLATAGLTLLGLGMATANLELLVLAAMILLLLGHPLAFRTRASPVGVRLVSTRTPRRGDPVDVELRLGLAAGPELVEIHSPLPPSFTIETGNNLQLVSGAGRRVVAFRGRAFGRGAHIIPALTAEVIDPVGVVAPRRVMLAPEESIEVTPRSFPARPLRGRSRDLGLHERERARLGVGRTDFRELREYAWGDPPKAINWKATARRMSARAGQGDAPQVPFVNEFEQEDRRTVVVLLDGGAALRIGTTLETGLDHGVEAALAAARFFLSRGSRVGAAAYGARTPHAAPPEAGSGQLPAIERALAPGELDENATAVRALETLHRHLVGGQPLVVLVTRITPRNRDDVLQVARRLRALLSERRAGLPMLVVDVDALSLTGAGDDAAAAAALVISQEDATLRREVIAAGARVVTWRPGERDFRAALLARRTR